MLSNLEFYIQPKYKSKMRTGQDIFRYLESHTKNYHFGHLCRKFLKDELHQGVQPGNKKKKEISNKMEKQMKFLEW